MSTAAVIGLGIFAWILLSTLLALFVGRMIKLRDRQRPDRSPSAKFSATEFSATDRAGTTSQQPSGPDPRDEP